MSIPHLRPSRSRIFINYRRDDAGGVAGRLSDSLGRYFGDGRVFRDVDGIEAGANFEAVLKSTSNNADAMIVLIGRQWATMVGPQGRPRLHEPDDWVAREIAAALEKKIPVYPVLIENAVMPRADELPPGLQPLVRHNAISISDHRWSSDVTRLAKIVAISVALFASVALTLSLVCWHWFYSQVEAHPVTGAVLRAREVRSVEPALLGITFVVIVGCSMLLLFFARYFDPPRRLYAYAAAIVGLLGTLTFFVLYWVFDGAVHESAGMVFGSTVTALAVLILMNQTGFKAR